MSQTMKTVFTDTARVAVGVGAMGASPDPARHPLCRGCRA